MDLDDITDELYRLPPNEFTRARNARAADARKQDRALAARIRELRRPTTAAWMANTLAHHHPDETTRLAELGRALRDAQDALNAGRLLTLTAQRREIITELTGLAVRDAGDSGARPAEDAVRELEQTLHAALADEQAATAFASGHLTTALTPGTVLPDAPPGTVLPDAHAGAAPEPSGGGRPAPTIPRSDRGVAAGQNTGTTARSRSAREAKAPPARDELRERHLAQARQRIGAAEQDAAGAEARAERLRADHQHLTARGRELKAEAERAAAVLARLEQELTEVERSERFARTHLRDAEQDTRDARQRLAEAQQQLDDLRAARSA